MSFVLQYTTLLASSVIYRKQAENLVLVYALIYRYLVAQRFLSALDCMSHCEDFALLEFMKRATITAMLIS